MKPATVSRQARKPGPAGAPSTPPEPAAPTTVDVSCVIPTYENLDLASRAIMSALFQTGVTSEVLISDDSRSSDIQRFVDLVAPAFPQLAYARGPGSGNAVQNWNAGLARASGRYCVLLHHDEFFLAPTVLARACADLDRTGRDWRVAPTRVIAVEGTTRFHLVQSVSPLLRRAPWTLFGANWIGPCGCLTLRREVAPRFDETLKSLVDIDFYYRMFERGEPVWADGAAEIGSLGRHGAQITADADIAERSRLEFSRLLAQRGGAIPPWGRLMLRAARGLARK